MYVSFDPSQGDNTDVFHNLNIYRGEEERTPQKVLHASYSWRSSSPIQTNRKPGWKIVGLPEDWK